MKIIFCMLLMPAFLFCQAQTDSYSGILFPIQNYSFKKWGYIDSTGKVAITFKFDVAGQFENGLARVTIGDLHAYINTNGDVVHEGYLSWYEEGRMPVKVNERFGFLNQQGRLVIPYAFEDAGVFRNGFTYAQKNGKYGLIDTNGKAKLDFVYEDVGFYTEGLVPVKKNGKWGFMDLKGNTVIAFEYEYAGSFYEGLAGVAKDKKVGFINKEGKLVIDYQFENMQSFSEGRCAVKKGSAWGYIDKAGTMVVPCQYDEADSYEHGIARVHRKEKSSISYEFIDPDGKLLCDNYYRLDYAEGFTKIKKPGSTQEIWGYADSTGKVAIDYRYHFADPFNGGLALVSTSENNYFFIDKTGKKAFSQTYPYAWRFVNDLAVVQRRSDGRFTFIDRKGVEWQQTFDDASTFYRGTAIIRKDGLFHLIDVNGKILISSKYRLDGFYMNGMASITYNTGSNARVDADGRIIGDAGITYYGYVDRNGKEYFFLK